MRGQIELLVLRSGSGSSSVFMCSYRHLLCTLYSVNLLLLLTWVYGGVRGTPIGYTIRWLSGLDRLIDDLLQNVAKVCKSYKVWNMDYGARSTTQ